MSKREKSKEIKIKTKNGFETIWLTKTVELKKQHSLTVEIIDKVYQLCLEGFVQEESLAFRQDVMKHIVEEENVCLAFEDQRKKLSYGDVRYNRVIAFASYRVMKIEKEKVLYISGVVVAPEKQRQNLASSIIRSIIEKEGVRTIALRTQNPVMYASLGKICGEVFPKLSKKEKIPRNILSIGDEVASRLSMAGYKSSLMTEEGTYGGHSLYGIKPNVDKNILNLKFETRVNITRGDSVIVIGVIDEKKSSFPLPYKI